MLNACSQQVILLIDAKMPMIFFANHHLNYALL